MDNAALPVVITSSTIETLSVEIKFYAEGQTSLNRAVTECLSEAQAHDDMGCFECHLLVGSDTNEHWTVPH